MTLPSTITGTWSLEIHEPWNLPSPEALLELALFLGAFLEVGSGNLESAVGPRGVWNLLWEAAKSKFQVPSSKFQVPSSIALRVPGKHDVLSVAQNTLIMSKAFNLFGSHWPGSCKCYKKILWNDKSGQITFIIKKCTVAAANNLSVHELQRIMLHRKYYGKFLSDIILLVSRQIEALIVLMVLAFKGLHTDIKFVVTWHIQLELLKKNGPQGEREPTIGIDVISNTCFNVRFHFLHFIHVVLVVMWFLF